MLLVEKLHEFNEKLAADVFGNRFYARLENGEGMNDYAIVSIDAEHPDEWRPACRVHFNKFQLNFRDDDDLEYRNYYIDRFIMNYVSNQMNYLIVQSDFWPTHRGLIRDDQ